MILLMAEILHQLLVVSPIIYRVLAPSQVVQDFLHQQYVSSWFYVKSIKYSNPND